MLQRTERALRTWQTMEAAHAAWKRGRHMPRPRRQILLQVVDYVMAHWEDEDAAIFVLEAGGKTVLIGGDTLYTETLADIGRRWDLSYGIYLYAWPIQVLLVLYLGPSLTPYTLLLLAFAITAGFAWLSWHLIEAPCLRLKPR